VQFFNGLIVLAVAFDMTEAMSVMLMFKLCQYISKILYFLDV